MAHPLMKPTVRLLLLGLCLFATARFTHHQTKGFRLSKIQKNTTCLEGQKSPPMPPTMKEVCKQPFSYLGRGLHCFSFVSQDGKVVLKLFNNRYQRRLFWLDHLPLRSLWQKKIDRYASKWKRNFESYRIASSEFQEQSGLLFYHPQKCTECPTVTIIDPLQIAHTLDLCEHAFALQKRAQDSFDFFRMCEKNQDKKQALLGLHSLVSLFHQKEALEIEDSDPLIRTNVGFYEGKAMQIDLGPFSHNPSGLDRSEHKRKTENALEALRHFMERETPSLLPYFDEVLANEI